MNSVERTRHQVIDALVADVTPIKRPGQIGFAAVGWLCFAWFFTLGVMALVAPFRSGWLLQLLLTPRFAVESVLGMMTIALLAFGAFQTAIPGRSRRGVMVACGAFVVWVGCYVFGLIDPALPPSMAGKRPHCVWEVVVYALPPMLLGLYGLRRYYPLKGALSGGCIAFAAGAMPALLMQFACMYTPQHILIYHLLPGMLVGVLGALLGYIVLKR